MPKSKYEDIYKDLKKKIESKEFPMQELLPSEHILIHTYDCSRNTIRRAISMLVTDGYVQTMQGLGVRNIFRPVEQNSFALGEIESFRESALRNGHKPSTKVIAFAEIAVNESMSKLTGFPIDSEIYYIQRLHVLDGKALILNHNYFLKSEAAGLTSEIAAASIYDYLENTLHMTIVNSRRIMSVEKVTELDEAHLDIDVEDYNCMAVVTSFTYNSRGVLFEFTQSRHRPDYFRFQDNAIRKAHTF